MDLEVLTEWLSPRPQKTKSQENHKKHWFPIFKKLWTSEVEFKAKHPQRERWNPMSLICIWLTSKLLSELRGRDWQQEKLAFSTFFHLLAGCYLCSKKTKKFISYMQEDNSNLDMTKLMYLKWKKSTKKRLYMRSTSQNIGWMGNNSHSSLACYTNAQFLLTTSFKSYTCLIPLHPI